jgi:hypothetical protein
VSEEKRANIHAGGKGIAFEPDELTKRIAIKAAHVLGADICAVDMLPSAKGPVVIEINLSPGLQGITKATGKNVADSLAKFLYKKTEKLVLARKKIDSSTILKELGINNEIKKVSTEIITNLEFRGERVLLPETLTKLAKLNDKDEYSVKIDGKELRLKRM